jgi:hypothetical protein
MVDGKGVLAGFTKVLTAAALPAFLNGFFTTTSWAYMLPFFLTYTNSLMF